VNNTKEKGISTNGKNPFFLSKTPFKYLGLLELRSWI